MGVASPPSSEGTAKTGGSEVDLPESLTRVAGALWPLFEGLATGASLRPTIESLDRALAPLDKPLRLVAGVLFDAGSGLVEGVTTEAVLGRMAVLGQGASGVARALSRRDADARWVEGLYGNLEALRQAAGGDPGERRSLLAAAIALSGRLPLGLDGVEAVQRHEQPVLAIAVGDAARSNDPGARSLTRDLLASPATSDAMALSVLFGLGAGAFVAGFERLVALASGAITEPGRWAQATQRAAALVCGVSERARPAAPRTTEAPAGAAATEPDNDGRRGDPLIGALIGAMALSDSGAALLDALPGPIQDVVVATVRLELTRHPPTVRAAVARAYLTRTIFGGAADRPDAGRSATTSDLLRERSPPVLLMILDVIARLGDALEPELKAALGRAWSDHPDVGVRRALAAAMGPRAPSSGGRDASAEVVALPPAALARDDLDRLRAALWAGESEHLVELATCVPLDRRTQARESLLMALEIPNAPLRRAIVEAIGRIGSHVDGPRLLDAARRYRALEGTVAAALRELSARAVAESLAEIYRRRLKWADDDAVDDYCAIAGPEQVMHLVTALETRYYPSARAGAARAIARRRASEGVFALRNAALSDTQETARLAALGALHDLTGSGPSGDEVAGHALLFRATEELPDTIERAREAGPAALNGIRRTLLRGSWKRRRAACDVLATLQLPEATEVLIEVLEDPDEDVRLAAVEALAQRGWQPSNAREATLQALGARRIREHCEGALADAVDPATLIAALGMGGHVFRAEVLDVLGDVLGGRTYLPSPEEIAVVAAARMDVATATRLPHGIEAVLRAIDHTWQASPHRARFVRELACVPSAMLVAQLAPRGPGESLSWRAREAIAQALERQADPVALEGLGHLVLEDDDDVRRAALQALAWIGSPAAASEVAHGFESPFQEDRDLVARALGTFGPCAAEVIDRLMGDAWWESRQGAALTLGHWRSEAQAAVDRLMVLAADPEYRVAQAAREGLAAHGLLPTTAAVCEALARAQLLTLEGLEPWLGLHLGGAAPPEIAARLDAMIEELPPDALPQRVGLIATFRAEHLALWLEDVALGRGDGPRGAALARHVGVRLAAADALRALARAACPVCQGERTVRCPGCNGAGDVPCQACQGRGTVLVRCPDPGCTAHGTLRRIDSRRCPTCRGRGEVPAPCACEGGRGRVPCALCHGGGRLGCSACDGAGHAHAHESAPR